MKLISLFERRRNPKYRLRFKPELPDHYIYVRSQKVDEVTGRPVTTLEKKINRKDRLSHFKISDFFIENLRISGAIDGLTSTKLDRDNLTLLSHLENSAKNIVNNNKTDKTDK